ncbi:TetR/AcrR family transcriptional regulator C-terminal domain-containing protein [Labrys wisconsinensis]|uniref:TetR/AcrR family tetracycline transcriptional repressor n=1 Tax=Labrys wisconsinensis TaxID=425677 RepID=A0ABU0JEU2_9HYPH|nr:TetR/AcrR family transcriptional regulator C-terminal domain-containing protein [Labrys wisconsinensis]MDQ0472021.1 TetR/AcrR family tetracycline transcriptional repressor [Labrys wisconsinensis]
MKVDRSRIVDEALRLLNEVGIDGLSTRLLAERLGVRQPALYWHFPGKRALLAAMNREILARGQTSRPPRPGEDWRGFLAEDARSFRRALTAYRDGARVHAGSEPDPDEAGHVEVMLRFLAGAGMAAPSALQLLIALGRYTVGCVLEEQAAPAPGTEPTGLDAAAQDRPLLAGALAAYRAGGHEAAFEAGLALLLDGAAAAVGS